MMTLQTLLLFTGAELVFSLTPGPAVMMITSFGFRGGMRAAFAASTGVQAGNAIYIIVSALGMGALLAASALGFLIVKALGAAYLVYLGIRTIWRAGERGARTAGNSGRPFLQGMLTQLGNPKAVLYFGAFLPQFLDPHKTLWPQYLEMFAIIMVGETSILNFYGWLAAQGARFSSQRFARWQDRISGAIYIAIGAIFATARRA